MDKLIILRERLLKLGIEIIYIANYPWIYLGYINGIRVKEKFKAKHGFTVAFSPIKLNGKWEFTDITEIFKLIRKYIKTNNKKK